jgi:hypothetical protein
MVIMNCTITPQGLDHVAENVLSFLDARSLCAAELVSKEWLRVISEVQSAVCWSAVGSLLLVGSQRSVVVGWQSAVCCWSALGSLLLLVSSQQSVVFGRQSAVCYCYSYRRLQVVLLGSGPFRHVFIEIFHVLHDCNHPAVALPKALLFIERPEVVGALSAANANSCMTEALRPLNGFTRSLPLNARHFLMQRTGHSFNR